jgi:hypothetical protein
MESFSLRTDVGQSSLRSVAELSVRWRNLRALGAYETRKTPVARATGVFLMLPTLNYFLVAQKISAIASISLSNLSATATSLVFFASPAVLVAVQKSSCKVGCASR